jgi:AraC family transcriptional regulator
MQKLQVNRFYVETLKSHKVSGLELSYCVYPSELETPRHTHENAFFGFALEGAYSEKYKNHSLTFEPSVVAFHPPGEAHTTQFHNRRGRIFRIEADSFWLERMRQMTPHLIAPANFRGVELSRVARKLYQEFCRMDQVSPFAIEGLMLEILAEVSRCADVYFDRKAPRWLAQVRELLHAHFQESLSLAEIAATANVHPAYLARAFRKHYRCTIGDYVRQRRVEFACDQLVSSDSPLIEIALAAGFCAQSHFNEFFKRETGLTPREYRNTFRTGKSD